MTLVPLSFVMILHKNTVGLLDTVYTYYDYFKGQLKSLDPSDLTVHPLHTSLDAILKPPTGSWATCDLNQGSEPSLFTGNKLPFCLALTTLSLKPMCLSPNQGTSFGFGACCTHTSMQPVSSPNRPQGVSHSSVCVYTKTVQLAGKFYALKY